MRFFHMATRLASTHQGGLGCGLRRPADAGDQHPARSSAYRHRAEAVHDARLPSSPRESAGVSARTRPSVPPRALPAPRSACGPRWGGSGRRHRLHTRRVPQPANPHVGRLSMSGDTSYHEIRGNVTRGIP